MKRPHAKKDAVQQARGRLRASPNYANARTRLAEAQTRRIEQIRKRDAGTLIESHEVRSLLVALGGALRSQLTLVGQTVRARHQGVDPAVIATMDELHRRALSSVADELGKLDKGDETRPANDDGEAA